MSAQVSSDPFSRETVHRRVATVAAGFGCAFCGDAGRLLKSGKRHLYVYSVKTDSPSGGRSNDVAGGKLFCGIACMRAYTT